MAACCSEDIPGDSPKMWLAAKAASTESGSVTVSGSSSSQLSAFSKDRLHSLRYLVSCFLATFCKIWEGWSMKPKGSKPGSG